MNNDKYARRRGLRRWGDGQATEAAALSPHHHQKIMEIMHAGWQQPIMILPVLPTSSNRQPGRIRFNGPLSQLPQLLRSLGSQMARQSDAKGTVFLLSCSALKDVKSLMCDRLADAKLVNY